jgi:multiple sugar transport system permease protein
VFFFSFVRTGTTSSSHTRSSQTRRSIQFKVGLSNLLSSTPSFNPAVGGGGQQVAIFRPELALATLLAVIPVAIVFMLSQRALVRGLVTGAVKN